MAVKRINPESRSSGLGKVTTVTCASPVGIDVGGDVGLEVEAVGVSVGVCDGALVGFGVVGD